MSTTAPAAAEPLRLPPHIRDAIASVEAALADRAKIDQAIADKRAEAPDVAALAAEADRLATDAETELALSEAGRALGEDLGGKAGTLQKQAKAAREKHGEAKVSADRHARVLEALEERARRADDVIAAEVLALNSDAKAFVTGEVREAWRQDFLAAAEELVRQAARGYALEQLGGGRGDAGVFRLDELVIPNPGDPRHVLYESPYGAALPNMRGNLSTLATQDDVAGDLTAAFAQLVSLRRQIAAYRPYSPPKPPAAPYVPRAIVMEGRGPLPAALPAAGGYSSR